jgi:hypothetical protein
VSFGFRIKSIFFDNLGNPPSLGHFYGEAFQTKVLRAPVSLHSRISADASEEERVKAIAEKEFT